MTRILCRELHEQVKMNKSHFETDLILSTQFHLEANLVNEIFEINCSETPLTDKKQRNNSNIRRSNRSAKIQSFRGNKMLFKKSPKFLTKGMSYRRIKSPSMLNSKKSAYYSTTSNTINLDFGIKIDSQDLKELPYLEDDEDDGDIDLDEEHEVNRTFFPPEKKIFRSLPKNIMNTMRDRENLNATQKAKLSVELMKNLKVTW